MNSKVFERGVFLMKYNEIKLEEKEEKLEILRQETPLPLPVFPAIAAVAKTLACNKRT